MKRILVPALLVLSCMVLYASDKQVDPAKLDSLGQSIEQSTVNYQQWQDSFQKEQDSIYKAALNKSQPVTQLSSNLSEVDANTSKLKIDYPFYLGVGFAIVFIVLLLFVLYRKKEKKLW